MKKLFSYPWYLSFWFFLIATTALYVVLSFSGGLSGGGTPLGYVTGFIGLFVPIGYFNFVFSLGTPTGFVSFLLVALSIFFADVIAERWHIASKGKIAFDLAWLFLLTLVVDLLLYQTWPSLFIFLGGGINAGPTLL
jgi:hypothetical protein